MAGIIHKWFIAVSCILVLGSSVQCLTNEELFQPCTFVEKKSGRFNVKCINVDIHEVSEVLNRISLNNQQVDNMYVTSQRADYLKKRFFENVKVTNAIFNLPNLETINNKAFEGQENSLKYVQILSGLLEEIPSKSLKNLNKLDRLMISNSSLIETVGKDTFEGFKSAKSLRHLILSNSGIKTIEEGAFVPLTGLQVLYLGRNQLKSLDADCFPSKMVHLRRLSLRYNQLESLSLDLLGNLTFGATVDVTNNDLKGLTRELYRTVIRKNLILMLNGNDVQCDCSVMTVVYANQNYLDNVKGNCTAPAALKSRSLSSLEYKDLPDCVLESEDMTAVIERNNEYLSYTSDKFDQGYQVQLLS